MEEDKRTIIIEDLDNTSEVPVAEVRAASAPVHIENLDDTGDLPSDRLEALIDQDAEPILPRRKPEAALTSRDEGQFAMSEEKKVRRPKQKKAARPDSSSRNLSQEGARGPKGMSARKIKIIALALAVLLVIGGGGFLVYYLTENSRKEAYYQDHFLPGTFINSVDCSGMTVQEVTDFFSQEAENYTLTITDILGQTDVISADEIHLEANFDLSFQTLLEAQNPKDWRSAENNPVEHTAGQAWIFDEVLLSKRISTSGLFQKMTLSQDAAIVYNETTRLFEVQPEVIGTKVDLKQVSQAAIEAVRAVKHELSLEEAGCYASVKRADEAMSAAVEAMNQYCKGSVELLFAPQPNESMPESVLKESLVLDASNRVTLDEEPIRVWVESLAVKYDTYGTKRSFDSTDSGTVTLEHDGTYGWKMNIEDTLALVLDAMRTGTPYKGEPVWDRKAASHTEGADFGDTYIEVDLNEQKAYFYRDGEIEWSSSVVSGCPAKGHHTVTGVYYIYEKAKNRTLRGAQADDGTYAYQSFVKYWMPFCGGYGMHDASWRGSFGGTIYKYSGSHGCVNLPPSKAAALYELISVGTPVIVFGGIADFGTDEPYTGAGKLAADGVTKLKKNDKGEWVDDQGQVYDPLTWMPMTTAPATPPLPEGETPAPAPTTPAPETTTPAPETTTPAPETTTPAPETTTPAPETTTPAPETTTPAPETTTPAPETTTQAPPAEQTPESQP